MRTRWISSVFCHSWFTR